MGDGVGKISPTPDGRPAFLKTIEHEAQQYGCSSAPAASSVLLRVLVVRAQKIGAHFVTETLSKCARVSKQRDRYEQRPHARMPFSRRRVRAAARCPSSRPTSARATATPRLD